MEENNNELMEVETEETALSYDEEPTEENSEITEISSGVAVAILAGTAALGAVAGHFIAKGYHAVKPKVQGVISGFKERRKEKKASKNQVIEVEAIEVEPKEVKVKK